MRLPRPAPFVCRACTRSLRATSSPSAHLARDFLNARTYATARDGRPLRLAVIGSGPAGFYSAYRVMSRVPDAVVDMYERQPVPYGLVRFGVAPDHPEVKKCQEKFEEVAASPRFNFIGNVQIGHHLPLTRLTQHYDAILFSYGASMDKELGISGEDLEGVYSARAFVGWYNGLPEYSNLDPVLDMGKDAVVVGQGNVALDVARILLSNVDELRKTDIAEHALEKLSRSKIDSVRIVGRRGPMQAAFTIKEIRELFNLPNVFFKPIPSDAFPPADYKLNRQMKRLTKILQEGSPNGAPPPDLSPAQKQWSLDFNLSPTSFNAGTASASASAPRIASATFQHTAFIPDSDPFDRAARVVSSDRTTTFPAAIAFRSVGYKSEPLPEFRTLGIPFDYYNGIIPHDRLGRIAAEGGHLAGMYVAGWVKRGPTGVIASTMEDAFVTADSIVDDWKRGAMFLEGDARGWEVLKGEVVAGARPVSWEDWRRIDGVERERGRERGKERVKFVTREDMLRVLDG
ncbi:ferredoxin-nadp+ reductase [Diplodia corticola]|uniref:NADPH:adrenodoxin oxidoreductase, mitochondrial n=1 Tax=Diplodia corticola TaxID=236234 RepID=A0A1J9RI68_9PEZI|nr:ferredoxin-nadp+ reductase [Diplodia corticola]OJD32251.1 ferredoxin-nadp+ reductase [Diplodia corticola]